MDKELITAAFDAVVCIFDAMEDIGSRSTGAAGNCFENIYSLKEKPNCKIVTKVNF